MLKRTALCGLFLTLPQWVVADQVVLKNGDTLQGSVVTLQGDKLVFKSPVLGDLEIPMAGVSSFSTDQPIELHLENGQVIKPVLKSAPAGFIQPEGASEPVALAEVAALNPPPEKPVVWTGKVFAGLNIETGNTEAQDTDLDVKAIRESKKDRVILSLHYEEDRREDDATGDLTTSKRYSALGGHYDYFWSPKRYLYTDGKWERETTADIDKRLVLGGGAGYRWVETKRTRFEVESGLSWVSETFTDGTNSDSYTALRAATRLTHDLSSDISLFNDVEWLASLADSEDQLFSMDTGLAYQVNGHLSLEARWHYDWDKSPAMGNDRGDARYVFGASWGF